MNIKNLIAVLLTCTMSVSVLSSCGKDKETLFGGSTAEYPNALTEKSFLKTDGTHIKDNYGKGKTVSLKGTNIGGWLHLEGWMDGGGTTSLYVTNEKRKQWTLKSNVDGNLEALRDNDTATYWSDNGTAGSFIIIDMKENVRFSSVYLESSEDAQSEYIGQVKLSWSSGGVAWREITSKRGSRRTTELTGFDEITARYLRVEKADNTSKWNIAEIRVADYTTVVDYDVRAALKDQFSVDEVNELLDVYQNAYMKTDDLDYIASLGMNFIRVPIYWQELMDEDGMMKSGAFDQIDWVINESGKRGIYVLLDMHGTQGGHTSGWDTGGQRGSNEMWVNSEYQDRVITMWQSLATRYKGNPAVAGYDLLNEPVPEPFGDTSKVIKMYSRIYDAIREIDPDHMIYVCALYKLIDHDTEMGGARIQNFNDLSPIGLPESNDWENVVYQTHHYYPEDMSNSAQLKFVDQQLKLVKKYQESYNVPILAGEFCFYSSEDAWEKWLQGLNDADISWLNWSYKNTFTDGENMRGIFYGFNNSICFQKSAKEAIETAFKRYETKNYSENTKLAEILKKYTK